MPREADELLLHQLEMQLLGAETRASPNVVADLLADDFMEFGSSGLVFDKTQTVAGLVGEALGPAAIDRSARDVRVKLLADDVALVTYRAIRRYPGGVAEVHTLRSSVWRFAAGRWRMVFHQGTKLAGPDLRAS